MRHSWPVPILLAIGVLAGYVLTTRPVQAQGESFPFQVGDKVEFAFPDDGIWTCRVEEIKGMFARCGDPSDRRGPTIGRREPPEEWVNVRTVKWVKKPREQR